MKNTPEITESSYYIVWKIQKNVIDYLLVLQKKYGDIFYKENHGKNTYQICHPDFAKYILSTNQDNYRKHPFVIDYFQPFVGKDNILTNNNIPEWQQDRNLTKTAFESTVFFDKYSQAISAEFNDYFTTLQNKTRDGFTLSVPYDLDKLILRILNKTIYYNINMDIDSIVRYTPIALKMTSQRVLGKASFPWSLPWVFNKKFNQIRDIFNGLTTTIIQSRLESDQHFDDLLESILHGYDIKTIDASNLQHAAHNVLLFIIAGYFTTSSTLSWIFIMLSLHPHIQHKISEEIATICNNTIPNYNHFLDLHYTRAVVSETLRMYPVVPRFIREAISDDEIMGHSIPAGSGLLLNPCVIHRHPDFWENPNVFDPSRFLDNPLGQSHQYAFIPFGGGKRRCLGKNFAFVELCLLLALFLQKFKLDLVNSPQIKIDYSSSLIMRPTLTKIHFKNKQ